MRKLFAAAFAASLTLYGAGQGSAAGCHDPVPGGQFTTEPVAVSPDLVGGSVTPSSNQRIADAIADRLNQSPMLKGFHVNISVQDGVADLAGTVMTQGQRAAVLEACGRRCPASCRSTTACRSCCRARCRRAGRAAGGRPLPAGAAGWWTAQGVHGPEAADAAVHGAESVAVPAARPADGRYAGTGRYAGADADAGWPAGLPGGDPAAADAAERLADVRPLQQLLARSVSDAVPVRVVPVHRPVLPVPEGPTRVAVGHAAMGGRSLVVRPQRDRSRLVACAVLVSVPPAWGAQRPVERLRGPFFCRLC